MADGRDVFATGKDLGMESTAGIVALGSHRF